jgi:hypothetical protein
MQRAILFLKYAHLGEPLVEPQGRWLHLSRPPRATHLLSSGETQVES